MAFLSYIKLSDPLIMMLYNCERKIRVQVLCPKLLFTMEYENFLTLLDPLCPTDLFTILELQNLEIVEFYVAQESRANCEASKLLKGRSEGSVAREC